MADGAESSADRGDAEAADSVLAEREETAVATGLKQTAGAAAAHVGPAVPSASSSDIFPAIQR